MSVLQNMFLSFSAVLQNEKKDFNQNNLNFVWTKDMQNASK